MKRGMIEGTKKRKQKKRDVRYKSCTKINRKNEILSHAESIFSINSVYLKLQSFSSSNTQITSKTSKTVKTFTQQRI